MTAFTNSLQVIFFSIRVSVFCLFFVFFTPVQASDAVLKKTVAVNMIIKDETKVIKRCLASVRPLIDYWVIVDTGSTDGTQEMVKEFMKDIPGELHERPWKNFEHNRNEALALAQGKADYLLIIDADDYIALDKDFHLPPLEADGYFIPVRHNGVKHARVQLIKNGGAWKWKGVVHEALYNESPHTLGNLDNLTYVASTEGSRSTDPKKYLKDALLLEEAVKADPDNTRNVFYLAQSYRDADMPELAIKNYQRRIDMGGWDEEIFWSMLRIAEQKEKLNLPVEEVAKAYFDAYHYKPSRAEPLYHLANYYRRRANYLEGYIVSGIALNIPEPAYGLFIEKWAYDYDIMLEYSICSYWVGDYERSKETSLQILAKKDLPDNVRECVTRNLSFANWKIAQKMQGNLSSLQAKQ